MKIGLIFPNIKESSVVFYSSVHQPAGLAYLAASLEIAGFEVIVWDMTASRMSFQDLRESAESTKPDVIGITMNVAIARQACLTVLFLKKTFPSMILVAGGPWASTNSTFLLERQICDIVVIGEGEDTMVELCRRIRGKEDLAGVKGLAFKDPITSTIQTGAPRPRIEHLDSLPFPAWHLFPPSTRYMHFNRYFPFFPLLATRGCAYDCIHCTKFVHGYKIRQRSAENVIEELKYLKDRFQAKEIIIIDDNFTADRSFCTSVLKAIIKNGLDIKINFANGIRADTVTPALVKLLKRAGTYSIALGVETGNDEMLQAIGKRTSKVAILHAAKLIKRAGIFLRTFFILGLPGDTHKTMDETISFARQLDADYAHFFIANPFPGTKMHAMLPERDVLGRGRFSQFYNKMDESNYVGFVPLVVLQRYHRRAYRTYYLRPRKILSLLGKFRTFQDVRWMFNFVVLLASGA